MNYEHLNKVHQYWRKELFPHLIHRFTATSFDDYLRKFSFTPSGKWLWDMEKVKLSRILFAVDPKKLLKKYEDHCVTYNSPVKPEDGLQRIIYQLTPKLHFEVGIWVWVEHDIIQSYGSIFVCYENEADYSKLADDLSKFRREGNTEDKPTKAGFADMIQRFEDEEVVK